MKSIRIALLSFSAVGALALAGAAVSRAEDRPPPGHRGPPPAALEACKQKNDGDACTVSFRDQSISGVCRTQDDQLVCWPDRPPPRPTNLSTSEP